MSNRLLRDGQQWNQEAITILNSLLGTALPHDTAAAITAAIAALKSTGWSATTGTLLRTNFGDASLSDTSQALRALIVDLKSKGLLGA